MGRTKPLFIERRVLLAHEVASYLGRSVSWFNANLPRLYAAGFPRPLDVMGGFDRKAIDLWLDRIGGLDRIDQGTLEASNRSSAWEKAANG